MNIRPPGVKDTWEDCDLWIHAMMIAYEQIRNLEDQENMINIMQMLFGKE